MPCTPAGIPSPIDLRHPEHVALHCAVRDTLRDGGAYLVCDHFAGEAGMQNAELFMSLDEQLNALRAAGFVDVECVLQVGTLALHRARR